MNNKVVLVTLIAAALATSPVPVSASPRALMCDHDCPPPGPPIGSAKSVSVSTGGSSAKTTGGLFGEVEAMTTGTTVTETQASGGAGAVAGAASNNGASATVPGAEAVSGTKLVSGSIKTPGFAATVTDADYVANTEVFDLGLFGRTAFASAGGVEVDCETCGCCTPELLSGAVAVSGSEGFFGGQENSVSFSGGAAISASDDGFEPGTLTGSLLLTAAAANEGALGGVAIADATGISAALADLAFLG